MAKYKITLRNVYSIEIPFYSEKHISILDALEQSKIYIDFQCREGFCGACRIPLYKGKVRYRYKPIAFVHANEILACSCHPITDLYIY